MKNAKHKGWSLREVKFSVTRIYTAAVRVVDGEEVSMEQLFPLATDDNLFDEESEILSVEDHVDPKAVIKALKEAKI